MGLEQSVDVMKLTVNKLAILTVVAFVFSPIISPLPGFILLVSTGCLWVSQQFEKISRESAGEEVAGEEVQEFKENETIINDIGDKIVIIEKKTILKKDITYEEAVKYNIKNVNCIGDCNSFEAPKVRNHYGSGHKHCMICNKWMIVDSINCPCCSSKLRTKEIIKAN